MSNTDHTAPIVAVFTPADAQALRAAMANHPAGKRMTDTMRDRIAAAIDQKYNEEAIGHTYEVCLHAADAVIAELQPELVFARYHKEYCRR